MTSQSPHVPATEPEPAQWQSPGQPAPGQPVTAQPVSITPGAAPPSPWGQPGYGSQAPWTAPSPGVVPLRPLGLAELLDGAWQTMRHNPRVMFGMSALVMAVTGILSTGAQIAGVFSLLPELSRLDNQPDTEVVFGPLISGGIAAMLLPAVLQSLALAVLNGLLIVAVSEAVLGRKPGAGAVLRRVGKRGIGRLLLLTLLTSTAYLLLVALVAAPVVGLWFVAVPAGIAGTVFGLLLLLVVGVFLWVRLSFAAPALLLEELRPIEAIRRSWRLVRGSAWRVLGVLLVAAIIAAVAQAVLGTPFSLVSQVVLISQGGDSATPAGGAMAASVLIASLGSIAGGVVVTPFLAAVTGLLYIDLRIRREGLDVVLARAAAAPTPPTNP